MGNCTVLKVNGVVESPINLEYIVFDVVDNAKEIRVSLVSDHSGNGTAKAEILVYNGEITALSDYAGSNIPFNKISKTDLGSETDEIGNVIYKYRIQNVAYYNTGIICSSTTTKILVKPLQSMWAYLYNVSSLKTTIEQLGRLSFPDKKLWTYASTSGDDNINKASFWFYSVPNLYGDLSDITYEGFMGINISSTFVTGDIKYVAKTIKFPEISESQNYRNLQVKISGCNNISGNWIEFCDILKSRGLASNQINVNATGTRTSIPTSFTIIFDENSNYSFSY